MKITPRILIIAVAACGISWAGFEWAERANKTAVVCSLPPGPRPTPSDDARNFVDPPVVLTTWSGIPVRLRKGDSFGVMLINANFGGSGPGRPRYILAAADGRVVDTQDPAVYAAALKDMITPGTLTGCYDVCSTGAAPGLSDEQIQQWSDMNEAAGLNFTEEETRITCTCP